MSKPLQESNTYVLKHPINGARVTCTDKYLVYWLARGFEVIEVTYKKM